MKIIGWDDWLIYARRDDGVLVFTILEFAGPWGDAPHQGICGGIPGPNCDGDQRAGCSADRQFVLDHVKAHPGDYEWEEVGYDTDDTALFWPADHDDEWAAESARRNLPKKETHDTTAS